MAKPSNRETAYSAGNTVYGGGRSVPNLGPVSAQGMLGYAERDRNKVSRNAALRKIKAMQHNKFASADANRGPIGGK